MYTNQLQLLIQKHPIIHKLSGHATFAEKYSQQKLASQFTSAEGTKTLNSNQRHKSTFNYKKKSTPFYYLLYFAYVYFPFDFLSTCLLITQFSKNTMILNHTMIIKQCSLCIVRLWMLWWIITTLTFRRHFWKNTLILKSTI